MWRVVCGCTVTTAKDGMSQYSLEDLHLYMRADLWKTTGGIQGCTAVYTTVYTVVQTGLSDPGSMSLGGPIWDRQMCTIWARVYGAPNGPDLG